MAASSSSPNTATPEQTYTTWRPPSTSASASTPSNPVRASTTTTTESSLLPTGPKSLSGISIRAFLLGTTLSLSTTLTLHLLTQQHHLWRLPFFLASLSLFHFLEFYTTATFNTRAADVSSFLLSSNGAAYNIAHSSAALECLISYYIYPENSYSALTAPIAGLKIQVVIGLFLIILGQVVRSLAMAQAGSNFNHLVQVERKDGHMLVTTGIYAWLRHPSYFGFFWWGLGTQLVLGNVVCFVGYAVVLWRFFDQRIRREEKFLIAFFGDEYVEYRKRTQVGIPGIP
ncbi:Isoprenylcysteine carboxyl methyltransferase family-domain-containing protein [Aspergillus karnatakaensis]|uniref:protein-S-isoprenylcysteine carboxyl O-methyltransferase n=1 Tax=Aspergillus karnatakaensis TaxID=1810916 RepID=UPI003CCD3071